MVRVILDTNILMAVGQLRVDIFSELEKTCDFSYTLAVLDKNLEELQKICLDKESSGKDKLAGKLALQIVEKKIAEKKIELIKTGKGATDDILVQRSKTGDLIVTVDKELKQRLKHYITIRGEKRLVVV